MKIVYFLLVLFLVKFRSHTKSYFQLDAQGLLLDIFRRPCGIRNQVQVFCKQTRHSGPLS